MGKDNVTAQILDAIYELFDRPGLGEYLQSVNRPPNGDPKFVGVDLELYFKPGTRFLHPITNATAETLCQRLRENRVKSTV